MGKLYFKLAKTNLSNNKPFYIPYIISSIITVAMLYMMSFLSDNKGLNKIMGADSLAIIFRLGVGIIVIFSYIFFVFMNRTILFIIRISVSIKFTAKIKDILFFKYTPIIIPVT